MSRTTSACSAGHDADLVLVDRRARSVHLTINRPDRLNALSDPMLTMILESIDEAVDDPEVRVVVIEGAGKAFCSGLDLSDPDPSVHAASMSLANRVITSIARAPLPVVASVRGPAAGLGCSIVLACDLSIMTESAHLLLAPPRIGLLPEGGATAMFATTAGRSRAMRAVLLAQRVDGEQACDWGLVTHVAGDSEIVAETAALVSALADGPTAAYAEAKAAINSATLGALDDSLESELRAQARLALSVDYREGLGACRDRRTPRLVGG